MKGVMGGILILMVLAKGPALYCTVLSTCHSVLRTPYLHLPYGL